VALSVKTLTPYSQRYGPVLGTDDKNPVRRSPTRAKRGENEEKGETSLRSAIKRSNYCTIFKLVLRYFILNGFWIKKNLL